MNYAAQRANMVNSQLRTNKVTDDRIAAAFGEVPRELFLPERLRAVAYVDEDLALGAGRYLIEPMVLARLLQAAAIGPEDVVLDIGCGTGYSSAILARLADTVVAVEVEPELAGLATRTLSELGIDNVVVIEDPLTDGYAKQAPYSAILIGGSVSEVPQEIRDQLGDGGRLVTVIREEGGVGVATLMQRRGMVVSSRSLFNAATPVVPGFARAPGFVF